MSLGETQHEDGMANLIEKYGADWFRSKFGSSYFLYKDMPAQVANVSNSGDVKAALFPRINGEVKKVLTYVDPEYFPDSTVFAVPELGYRHAQEGRYLAFVSRNNSSYHRGLSPGNVRFQDAEHTIFLREHGMPVRGLSADEKCNIIMQPTFIPFQRGIKLMLDGKIMSFAASPTIAVVPHADDDSLVVKLCSKEIGTVSPEGELTITAPFAQNYLEGTLWRQ